MDSRDKKVNILIILGAVCLVLALLGLLFFQHGRSQNAHTIVLPDDAVSQPSDLQMTDTGFAEVNRTNVQKIIQTLARPSAYRQALEITTHSGDFTRTQTVETWRSGTLLRAQFIFGEEVKNILTDGQTLYIWYQGENVPVSLRLDGTVSPDDLIGIPTYETILSLPIQRITEASFAPLADDNTHMCVYVASQQDGLRHNYWISLQSGLLCSQNVIDGDETVYSLTQTDLEVLADADEAFAGIFQLPDGTQPFAKAE
ncbi:MAG: hypothetical protein IIV87_05790 [Oscillospiraceae bacterium]|nr:hypothetical protein [Oscillospiraceae bacterium]